MKKALLIGVATALLTSFVSESAVYPKEILKRWQLDYAVNAEGNKISGMPQSPDNDYEFFGNMTYVIYSSDDVFSNGSWEYSEIDKCIYTRREDGNLNGKIVEITENTMILIPAGKSVENTPFEKFKYFFKAKNKTAPNNK